MKGTTHVTIGAALGVAAALSRTAAPADAAVYIAAASLSALAADLDGPGMLNAKLGKLSRFIRNSAIWGGLLLTAAAGYRWFALEKLHLSFTVFAVSLFLLGLAAGAGAIRNALVSLVGLVLAYGGIRFAQPWLAGLGAFVVCAPWLNHRGLTHTVWAVLAWTAIGWGFERATGIAGVASVCTAGYASHVLADMLTPQGVKLLYPLARKSFKL